MIRREEADTYMTGRDFVVPELLRSFSEDLQRVAWLDELPQLVEEAARHFGLEVGPPYLPGGRTSWVAPVRTADGKEAVLKVTWPHPEAEHEAAGLRCWAGEGSVLVYGDARLESAFLVLLERCKPGTELRDLGEEAQDEVIAGLLRRLWQAEHRQHPFRPLSEMCDQWADEYGTRPPRDRLVLEDDLAAEGMALLRSLPREETETVLLCTDLHASNVLSAEREPWLMIDPKPYVGDPAYDLTQHLLNCHERLLADPVRTIERLSSLTGMDPGRVRLWTFARCCECSPYWEEMAELARTLAP